PDAALTAAIDEPSLRAALEFMRDYDSGLSAVRYPRDDVSDRFGDAPPFELGKARCLTPGLACIRMQESFQGMADRHEDPPPSHTLAIRCDMLSARSADVASFMRVCGDVRASGS
ncbi:MAG: hypothetical protein AAF830_10550, partial [Pseudomonadota bacterium]